MTVSRRLGPPQGRAEAVDPLSPTQRDHLAVDRLAFRRQAMAAPDDALEVVEAVGFAGQGARRNNSAATGAVGGTAKASRICSRARYTTSRLIVSRRRPCPAPHGSCRRAQALPRGTAPRPGRRPGPLSRPPPAAQHTAGPPRWAPATQPGTGSGPAMCVARPPSPSRPGAPARPGSKPRRTTRPPAPARTGPGPAQRSPRRPRYSGDPSSLGHTRPATTAPTARRPARTTS